jgi:putative IMPACT (imprinted ancient) family translation regulator
VTEPGSSGPWRGILAPARAELRERGSRFVAHVGPAADPPAAQLFAAALARELFDATHHVRAQRILGPDAERVQEFASDGGEPAGTAGRPILLALAGSDIVNAVLVVSRWFGGTKLGRGGLARAYGAAARAAIEAAPIVPLTRLRRLEARAAYADAGALTAAARRLGARIERILPDAEYRAILLAPDERSAAVAAGLVEATAGRARVTAGERLLRAALAPD